MRTLIIVEDEQEIRQGMAELIPWAEIGFEVVRDFADGTTAIAWLAEHPVDVVVTDIMMSNGSGLDVAEYLSQRNRLETIVFYSAFRDFQYAQTGMRYGVKRYITKDMGYHEIIDVFREIKTELDASYHSSGDDAPGEDPVIASLMRYLRHSYRDATLQKAAGVVRMNANYLSTYIKKHTDENFKTILTRIRMEKARDLLADPAYRVSDVYRSVGYTDDRMFLRCFRNQFNMSPAEYRRRMEKPE